MESIYTKKGGKDQHKPTRASEYTQKGRTVAKQISEARFPDLEVLVVGFAGDDHTWMYFVTGAQTIRPIWIYTPGHTAV